MVVAGPTEFEIDDCPGRIDLEAVWLFLSTQAYWGRWRSRSDVEQQVRTAWRVVGVFHRPSGAMVGFARAVSDGVAVAYLADVFVLEHFRGHGLGRWLLDEMIERGPGAGFRWLLHTADAHGLYARYGFGRSADGTLLERPASNRREATPPTAAELSAQGHGVPEDGRSFSSDQGESGRLHPDTANHYQWGQHGQGWRLVDLNGLSVIEEALATGGQEEWHRHLHATQVFYVLRGQAELRTDGGTTALGVGTAVLVPPGTPHQLANAGEQELRFLVISTPSSRGDRLVVQNPVTG